MYPKQPRLVTDVDEYAALDLFDFGGLLSICTLMIIFSVTSLLFEIVYSQVCRKKMINRDTPSSKEYKFSYESKCGDLKNARGQFSRFLHDLDEGKLEISLSEASIIPSDTDLKLTILVAFKLRNIKRIGEIVEKFDAFTVDLDRFSQK